MFFFGGGSIDKVCYVYNGNKGGIAGALNEGFKLSKEDGYKYVLTLDQDSIWEQKQLVSYIDKVKESIKDDISNVSFAPSIIDLNQSIYWTKLIRFKILSPLKKFVLGSKYKAQIIHETASVDRCITSGNILSVKVWRETGGFDEDLFIDEVDYDICHKIKALGYNIIQFNTIVLHQHFGTKRKFSLLPRHTALYSKERLYYTFKNAFIEQYRFPQYKEFYENLINKYYKDYCIYNLRAFTYRKIYRKAYMDYYSYITEQGELSETYPGYPIYN